MNTPARKRARILVVGMTLALIGGAFAAEQPPAKSAAPSQQTREQMAKMHEQMAACLRSDKAFADCQSQMHQQCMAAMGEKGCPMMGAGMQHGKPAPASTDKQ
jgi:hypothetical protein